ncbi:esterase E4-like, partial [Danaus plexippus]|uniref:esterase E4-like n=1 Tax=Danaus plexippus TaxID=13037 RepID=UPI002AB2E7E3
FNFQKNPIVTVKQGKLRGESDLLFNGARYYSFKGIPYAAPPIGNLRFKAPQPPLPWKGIRDATKFGSVCTQLNQTKVGEEDCLFLNVYTRSMNKNAKTPVILYIFGGGFSYGSGSVYYGDFLLQHDVLLVTVNYRLEMLGFLSLDIPEAPGNAGMKDQVAALRWIRDNIINFGGDPDNVTIFGDSAAAGSVTFHMVSPMSRGLFHRAICQSGSFFNDWALAAGKIKRAFRVGKILGKETNDIYELYQYFMSLDKYKLTNVTLSSMTYDEIYRGPPGQFIPVIEKEFPDVEAFLTEHPITILQKGNVAKVPLIIGYNNGEGLLYLNRYLESLAVYSKEPSYFVGRYVANQVSPEKLEEFGKRIVRFYAGNKTLTKEDVNALTKIIGDTTYNYNIHRFINSYANFSHPIYMYKFHLDTELNVAKVMFGVGHLKGASHGDELWYLFKNFQNDYLYEKYLRLRAIIYRVSKLWTDFAKTGEPISRNSDEEYWKPFTIKNKEYYNIDDTFSMGYYADKERVEFWDEIYEEAGLPHIKSINVESDDTNLV